MRTVVLNNNGNAYPERQIIPNYAGNVLSNVREMRLSNFERGRDKEPIWVLIQFFDENRNSSDFVSLDHTFFDRFNELKLQIKTQYSSYAIILNVNDGEKEVIFDLDLITEN
ncbi:MAG TPA: hypothetical protein VFE32_11545 [Puia sp.]|jgi:hypothetical protein|nr:hypothetical protein [Puia sp.]